MTFSSGDHICVLYSARTELAETVAEFLSEGLSRGERCWYVAAADEGPAVMKALRNAGVDVHAESARTALRLIAAKDAYLVRGRFNPETTVRVFNDAIELALADGFTGFRAAAEMSWALQRNGGTERLIAYEALLRTLFSTSRVVGLCLYDRTRMPLAVINGALATHPIVGEGGMYSASASYDPGTSELVRPRRKRIVRNRGRVASVRRRRR